MSIMNLCHHGEFAQYETYNFMLEWNLNSFNGYNPFMSYHCELTHNMGPVTLCWNEIWNKLLNIMH
jgi:hypothetical protein